uniref:Phosphatidylinositol N-acetylglucosaminyltransferase subunit H conserved domain-containing protein n=1 Tax=Leptobrachium leishanense TaxID=445787 RepID=A0A8C5WLJ9_9ANUR
MEDRTFSDIEGGKIIVQERLFSKTCKEFNIICPKMSVRSVVTATFTAWVAAYAMYAYTENNMVLSATTVSTIIGLLFYLHFVKIDQESLLLIGSLGIQMTLTYTSGKESTEFIEMHKIKDVVINEAIFMVLDHVAACLSVVSDWITSRFLKLNLSKAELLIFPPRPRFLSSFLFSKRPSTTCVFFLKIHLNPKEFQALYRCFRIKFLH